MNRTAILTVAAALSLEACAHHDRTPDSKVPLGATEMQGTTKTSSSSPDDGRAVATVDTPAPSSGPEAVSTRVNTRSPPEANGAPTDQGMAAADVGLTQAIRRALVADKKLSAAAKNVTILSSDARVVLKGRVNSVRERASVEDKVRAMPGVTEVYDQLTVRR